ncbi:MAG: hypothetical protein M1813_008445 [Trichoglossum hirsutum]|nr:MAG: hypothetical protein M1813_008445 [Trichoglossum hirsutum]
MPNNRSSGGGNPYQPSSDDRAQRIVQCENCHQDNVVPVKCTSCSGYLPSLPYKDTQGGNSPKSKNTCERCGVSFTRHADKTRHQWFSCSVRRDATVEELFYCHLRTTEGCSDRGYRPDKLSDHLRQFHGFGQVKKSQGRGTTGASSSSDYSQVTPGGYTPQVGVTESGSTASPTQYPYAYPYGTTYGNDLSGTNSGQQYATAMPYATNPSYQVAADAVTQYSQWPQQSGSGHYSTQWPGTQG